MNTMIEADLSLIERFFYIRGRINRLTYFRRNFIFAFTVLLISKIIGKESHPFLKIFIGILFIAYAWSNICLGIKRCHDLNKPGIFYLPSIVPYINILLLMCLILIKGTDGPNKYGADPLKPHHNFDIDVFD